MTEEYSFIETPLICPVCGREFENTDGHMRVQLGKPNVWYRIGDPLKWKGPSWGVTKEDLERYDQALVFDTDDNYSIWKCAGCDTLFDAPAAVIEKNEITGVRIMTPAQWKELFGFDRELADVVGFDAAQNKWMKLR